MEIHKSFLKSGTFYRIIFYPSIYIYLILKQDENKKTEILPGSENAIKVVLQFGLTIRRINACLDLTTPY